MEAKVHMRLVHYAHCQKCGWVHMISIGTYWEIYVSELEARRAARSHTCHPEQVRIHAERQAVLGSKIPSAEMHKRMDELDLAWEATRPADVTLDEQEPSA